MEVEQVINIVSKFLALPVRCRVQAALFFPPLVALIIMGMMNWVELTNDSTKRLSVLSGCFLFLITMIFS